MNEPFQKPRRSIKSREVGSRYLQTTPASPSRDINGGHPSPSPVSQAPASPARTNKSTAAARKSRNHDDPASTRGSGLLWPSSAISSNPSTDNIATAAHGGVKTAKTLGDHFRGSKRLINEVLEEKKSDPDKLSSAAANSGFSALGRQRSGREVAKCESDRAIQFQKENHRPGGLGGSFRYAGGKLGFRGGNKPSSPSPSSSSSSTSTSSTSSNTLLYTNACYVPGRFSVDENALYKSSLPGAATSRRQSDMFPERIDQDVCDWAGNCAEFECFDPKIENPVSNRRRKSGIEVSSKYLNNLNRRGPDPKSVPGSPVLDGGPSPSPNLSPKRNNKKLSIKAGFRRAHSLTLPGSTGPSQWALSPGRTGSPPMTVENKERPMSFSTWKPPTSPKKHGGMEKLLSMGLDFFKSSAKIKRISSSSSTSTSTSTSNSSSSSAAFSTSSSSSSLLDNAENVHQLRLIHGRLLQWRYANSRAETTNEKLEKQAESDMVLAWSTIVRKRQNVVKMRLQLQREQLEVKLESILHWQMNALERWEEMERQHTAALSKTQESLNAVVCRVPLIKGARVNEELTSLAFRHATDLTNSIRWALSSFSSPADETVEMVSELAKVVAQEKLLIQEFHEIQHTISALQVEESDLKAAIIQLTSLQLLQQHHQKQEERC
ncbi:unnamed protein product [Linum trigynum]|uniref:QWRF motif-containing protein 3 n=1 Tax=Linum trigynum TaxID=586398 RepID=A0AAV2G891_9ROSI